MSITHLPDIGGAGFPATAAEVYEEGLRLPVCRLFPAGQPNEELYGRVALGYVSPEAARAGYGLDAGAA